MPRPTDRPAPKYSLAYADAIDTGLYPGGRATIERAAFDYFDFKMRNPVLVFLVTLAHDGEKSDQPYSIGRGLTLSKKSGELIVEGDPTAPIRFNKGTNFMHHFMKPLEAALAKAGIEPPEGGLTDVAQLEGMEVLVERVPQVKRNIKDDRRAQEDARRRRGREEEASEPEEERERTILEIHEVYSAPWSGNGADPKKKRKAAPVAVPEPEPETDEDDDEDDKPAPAPIRAASKPNGKPAPSPVPDEKSLTEEAVESLAGLVEAGKVSTSKIEQLLEKSLANHPNAVAIIDLATSPRFLQKQIAWVVSKDGKTIDAPAS